MVKNNMKKTDGKTEESSLTAEKHEHGKNPNSLANLQPFEKGVSGNPGGRNVKYAKLKNALMQYADQKSNTYDWSWNNLTFKERVLIGIWEKAGKGDTKMIEILAQLGCLDER